MPTYVKPTRQIQKKSPALAGLLSLILPGLGQLYNRQPTKGLSFLLCAGFVIIVWVYAFNTPRPLHPDPFEPVPWDNQDLFFALGPFLIGCIVWSVVDAFSSARRPKRHGQMQSTKRKRLLGLVI
ncbi:MAG: DUF5683 domain-containing protein [Nitrospiraceae bacterium]